MVNFFSRSNNNRVFPRENTKNIVYQEMSQKMTTLERKIRNIVLWTKISSSSNDLKVNNSIWM